MTEVISVIQSDGNPCFGSPLRRSSSRKSFLLHNDSTCTAPTLRSKYTTVDYHTTRHPGTTTSLPSSAPSSPRSVAPDFSNQPSYISTPSSSLSLDDRCHTQEQEEIVFPSYGEVEYYTEPEIVEPPGSPEPNEIDTVRQSTSDTLLASRSQPELSSHQQTAGDDTAAETKPTRQVDYLSHNWREEDVWSSWRHIVSKRKIYANSCRLENAAWRTWTKFKYQLKTISPETLNWMKDHDVTWLYGPLQTGCLKSLGIIPTPPTSQLSRSNSFATKKPILKKRTLSELMLQRSLSSSTLMKQATDALRAQQPGKRLRNRPILGGRTFSDSVPSSELGTPLTRITTDNSSTQPSLTSSGAQTPCTKRHIHFNNKVEQCIAINKDVDDCLGHCNVIQDDDESSEDEMLVMKPVKHATKARISSTPSTPRNSFSSESKTIAMLPSTTLNYRGNTPEPEEQMSKQKDRSKLFLSPSQQTLRPSSPLHNFLLDEDDEDADMNWQPSSLGRGGSFPSGGLQLTADDEESDAGRSGLRRTPSGMFMPYEEEDEAASTGLLGKAVDVVNTARDIAHVIWNVGWHR